MPGRFLHSLLKIIALKERSLLKMCIFGNAPVPVSLWCVVGAILRYATCVYSLWYWNELMKLPQINYEYKFYRKLKEFDRKILIGISSCHMPVPTMEHVCPVTDILWKPLSENFWFFFWLIKFSHIKLILILLKFLRGRYCHIETY